MHLTHQYISALHSLELKFGKLSPAAQADTVKRLSNLAPSYKELGMYVAACHEAEKVLTGLEIDMAIRDGADGSKLSATSPLTGGVKADGEDLKEESPLVNNIHETEEDSWDL